MKPLLKKYHNNETSDEETKQIEQQLMSEFFAKQERERWATMLAAEGIRRDSVTPEQATTALTGTVSPKLNKARLWWAAAASVVLLLGIAILMPSAPTHKATANLHQKVDNLLLQGRAGAQTRMDVRMSGLPADQVWETAKNAYVEGNFDKVIAEIEKIGEDINSEQRYYLAQAYLAKQNYPKAILNLDKVSKQEGLWSSEARWYLALSYIKNSQPELAKPILNTFLNHKWRNKEAQELLDEIK